MPSNTSRCRACQAVVEWVVTAKNGKAIPLDMGVDPTGNVEIVDGKAVVHGQEPMHEYEHRQSHFATCPNAREFSKSGGGRR